MKYWFPFCLICLLMLAVPGIILFALNLFGLEGKVNHWLMDMFSLSYHLPVPWWAVLILLLLPFAILLLYFLKLKRKPLSVPSTFLWKKSIEDLHVNSLFQWLRENVLLLLQILAVILLIYGVMAFHLHGQAGAGRHFIILIDNSASMSATDVAPNRLEWAKQEALKEIDAASDADIGMVIEFSDRAEIKQSYTSNRALLRQAVKDVQPTQRPTRIEEALSLADSLANPVRSTENAAVAPGNVEAGQERIYVTPEGIRTELHLFSDGRFPDLTDAALANLNSRILGNDSPLGNLQVHYHAAGKMVLENPAPKPGAAAEAEAILKPTPESADNVAIVSFNARRDELETTRLGNGPRDPANLQVFLRILNFSDHEVQTAVDIDVYENGKFKESLPKKSITLPPHTRALANDEADIRDTPGEATVSFDLYEGEKDLVLHARLVKVDDKFPLDNEAWLVLGIVRKARVLIVGPDNAVLRAFFADEATRAVAQVAGLTPADLAQEAYRNPARNGAYDLVIFDRCSPADERDLPRSNTFFIGRPPPPWKTPSTDDKKDDFRVVEKMEHPHIKGWDSKHPLLRFLSALHEIGLSEAFRMRNLADGKDLPERVRLMETDRNGAVLLHLTRGPFTDLVMTFPLLNDKGEWTTNWPLLPSFPLFLRNILYTLGNVDDAAAEERVQPGQVKVLRPDTVVKHGMVSHPDGKVTQLTHGPRDTRTDFVFDATHRLGPYRVKWEDGIERDFAVNLLDVEESNIEPRPTFQIGTIQVRSGQESRQPREIWRWFAFLTLLVLLAEWYIYNRRVYI